MDATLVADPIIMVYDNPAATAPSAAWRALLPNTSATAANAVRNQAFQSSINRDLAGDTITFYNTRNIYELPGNYWVGASVLPGQQPGVVPAGLKYQGFTDYSVFDFRNRMLDETSRQKELVTMGATTDEAGLKTVRRTNPNARTASPRLLDSDRRRTLVFTGRASAGVDVDPVVFAQGDTLEVRFEAKAVRVQETGMLVLCSVGDRIPIRLGVPANRPGRLYAYSRNQWEPVADFSTGQWHAVRLVVKPGEFLVGVDGGNPRTFSNPIVDPTPRVYLGDGFEVDYVASNAGSEFHIDLASLTSRVSPH